mmetsp:Transcript_4164/g.16198  ORF Transcript_4164/g.16198 Transcript_4164/m.16198 type:complete len:317 (+) Transcript_4164:502-1452(+)
MGRSGGAAGGLLAPTRGSDLPVLVRPLEHVDRVWHARGRQAPRGARHEDVPGGRRAAAEPSHRVLRRRRVERGRRHRHHALAGQGALHEVALQVRRMARAGFAAHPPVWPKEAHRDPQAAAGPQEAPGAHEAGGRRRRKTRANDQQPKRLLHTLCGSPGEVAALRVQRRGRRQLPLPRRGASGLRRRRAPQACPESLLRLHGAGGHLLRAVRGGRSRGLPALPDLQAAERRLGRRPRGPGPLRDIQSVGRDLGLRPSDRCSKAAHLSRAAGEHRRGRDSGDAERRGARRRRDPSRPTRVLRVSFARACRRPRALRD